MGIAEDALKNVHELGESINSCAIPFQKMMDGFRSIGNELKKTLKELLISDMEVKAAVYVEMCNHRDKASFLSRWLWRIRARRAKRALDDATRKLFEFSKTEEDEEKKDESL